MQYLRGGRNPLEGMMQNGGQDDDEEEEEEDGLPEGMAGLQGEFAKLQMLERR